MITGYELRESAWNRPTRCLESRVI